MGSQFPNQESNALHFNASTTGPSGKFENGYFHIHDLTTFVRGLKKGRGGGGRHDAPHFPEEETKTQRDSVTCIKSHSRTQFPPSGTQFGLFCFD